MTDKYAIYVYEVDGSIVLKKVVKRVSPSTDKLVARLCKVCKKVYEEIYNDW